MDEIREVSEEYDLRSSILTKQTRGLSQNSAMSFKGGRQSELGSITQTGGKKTALGHHQTKISNAFSAAGKHRSSTSSTQNVMASCQGGQAEGGTSSRDKKATSGKKKRVM
jgi:hypothetical protein